MLKLNSSSLTSFEKEYVKEEEDVNRLASKVVSWCRPSDTDNSRARYKYEKISITTTWHLPTATAAATPSVTRFGNNSPLWLVCKVFWQIYRGSFSIWQNFDPIWAIFLLLDKF